MIVVLYCTLQMYLFFYADIYSVLLEAITINSFYIIIFGRLDRIGLGHDLCVLMGPNLETMAKLSSGNQRESVIRD